MLTLVSIIGVDGRKYYYPADDHSNYLIDDACFSTHGICINDHLTINRLVRFFRLQGTPIRFNASIMPVY